MFSLLKKYDVKIIARVYIKPREEEIKFENIYTSSIQCLAKDFNIFLK